MSCKPQGFFLIAKVLITPLKKQFLAFNHHIHSTSRDLLDFMNSSQVLPSQQHSYLAVNSSGFSNFSFTQSDFYNYHRDARISASKKDVYILISKFSNLKAIDPSFYFSIHKDDKGTPLLNHCTFF